MKIAALLFGFLMMSARSVSADIYRYIDETGTVHFSDHPKERGYQKIVSETKPIIASPQQIAYKPAPSVAVVKPRHVKRSAPQALKAGGQSGQTESASLSRLIEQEAENLGMEAALVKAVVHAESSFNPEAVSSAGAIGLMQLMPATAADLGLKNPFDPKENVRGGIRYLRTLLGIFKNDLPLALAAYNAGLTRVMQYGKVPPFRETQRYVGKVIQFYAMYAQRSLPSISKVTRPSGEVVYTNRPELYSRTPTRLPVQF